MFIDIRLINIFAMEIDKENLFVPHKLGSLSVIKKDKGFSVLKDGQEHKVASYNTDKMLNKMNSKQLAAFLANNGGRIDVNQLSDDEYTLKAKVHGKGGGWLLGVAGAWAVRAVGYGVPIAIGATATAAASTAVAPVIIVSSTSVAAASGAVGAMTATQAAAATTVATTGVAAQAAIAATAATYASGVEFVAGATQVGLTAIWWLP